MEFDKHINILQFFSLQYTTINQFLTRTLGNEHPFFWIAINFCLASAGMFAGAAIVFACFDHARTFIKSFFGTVMSEGVGR
jgi:hypothetical protein